MDGIDKEKWREEDEQHKVAFDVLPLVQ